MQNIISNSIEESEDEETRELISDGNEYRLEIGK